MRNSSLFMLGAIAAIALGGVIAVPVMEAGKRPPATAQLQPVACKFRVAAGFAASCYRLRVPESRSSSGSMTLELPVAVISMPETRRRNDVVVYLAGGPGDGAWQDPERISFWWDFVRANPWLNQRDLILIDQRGTGDASPRMDCPEVQNLALPFLALGHDTQSAAAMMIEAASACMKRVKSIGHDPTAYTTGESTRDLHDLFVALDVGSWNVYGVSYGTRLALAYLKLFPDDFRSVILDSTDPPQIDFYADDARRTQRAFDVVLEACERDQACHSWYPNLAARLIALVERLNAAPVAIDAPLPEGSGKTRVTMTGDLLLGYLFLNLYNRADIEMVPQIIDVFDRGQMAEMVVEATRLIEIWVERDDWGEGLWLSIACGEDMPFTDIVAARNAYREYRLLRSFADALSPFVACPAWKVPAVGGGARELVGSSVPALVLAGAFDPITPPDYGRETAAALTYSWFFEFLSVGHDVLGNEPCAGRLAAMFLDNPLAAPNDPCLQSLEAPRFRPPGS